MSKLNPQNATAYVGPGVLRKGGKITPVPNGPLIKKKGPYAGSTLKSGGKIKKAQGGEYLTKEGNTYTSTKKVKTKNGPRYYQGSSSNMEFARELASNKALKINDSIPKAKLSARALEMMNKKKNGGTMKKKAQQGVKIGKLTLTTSTKDTIKDNPKYPGIRPPRVSTGGGKEDKGIEDVKKLLKNKAGGLIKRADGSYSKRGLWDNIRANKGSGKKPTKQMLQQEKKIKAKTKK
jgi:hypothetical protein